MLLSDIIKNKNLIKVKNFKLDKRIKYITSNSKLVRKDSILCKFHNNALTTSQKK